MAKKKKTISRKGGSKKKKNRVVSFFRSSQTHLVFGVFIFSSAIFLFVSFYSFFMHWKEDQSQLDEFTNKSMDAQNLFGKFGAYISDFLIYDGFGVSIFIFPVLLFFTGLYAILNIPLRKLQKLWFSGIVTMIWGALLFGYLDLENSLFAGTIGYEMNDYLQVYIGSIGVFFILLISFLIYIISKFRITPEKIMSLFPKSKVAGPGVLIDDTTYRGYVSESIQENKKTELTLDLEPDVGSEEDKVLVEEKIVKPQKEENENIVKEETIEDIEILVEEQVIEEHTVENLSDKLIKDYGEFDPTLDLATYKFPKLDLLKDYRNESIVINKEELEINKNKIVETLNNYKIGITSIKATIGPTVTLYEIVPYAGVRISKIKNLEDDIALSLAALGIRIIAPIPGKGTVGIEVPNKKPSVVSMKSVLSSNKFQESKYDLPIALGKNISNETYVIDLAKMPHLLMAGATGQGKSVGLNAVLASILYKKHPAEVKFVLVDPKKVELTLFNKIERHYLAKLPDTEEAIITDTSQVINTLNSLCIEMDDRYNLLKSAFVRNIKEYNAKFKARKLNPENGHKYLPYIILVIDEFADLIMTAGKEIETPIARLAQLARAIGIHLIVATQRPSVNVITGIIKANFPVRIAFRVTSKIDSRTILDYQGADQLIGKGDMLISTGSEMTRLQCAFIDTPEVENLTDYIGSQRAYASAYLLPEFVGEESGTGFAVEIGDRDKLFEEAANLVVTAQQGSASLLQRKLKLGYNRAGRIIDQLEAASIVGPFEGSKARQVLVYDLVALRQLLDDEKL